MDYIAEKMLAIRVYNTTRSCILMRQFNNNIWTLPMVSIPHESDPIYHIDNVLNQIKGDFKLISAVSMIDYTDTDVDEQIRHSIVYDIKYKGKIYPECPDHCKDMYKKSQWMQIEKLKNRNDLNHPTLVFAVVIESQNI